MKHELKSILLILGMICALQLGFAQVSLTIDPPESHIGYDETVTLSVNIAEVLQSDPMRGFEMTVNYDPTYLTITADDFTEGTFLSDAATPEFGTQFYAIGMEGAITVSCAILGVPPDHQPPSPWGAYGDGTLFTMTFTSLSAYNCVPGAQITLSDIILRNEVNQPIEPVSVTGATIFIHPTISIALEYGWNLVSSPYMPVDPDMEAVFADLISTGKLIKVQDENGDALELNEGVWMNNIGNFELEEGYYVKVNQDCILEISGCPNLPLTIDMAIGWNIISYPYMSPTPAMTIIQPLIDSGVLVKVQNEDGLAVEYNSGTGEWINNIGDFVT
ncbi:MAG: cohesin domain-containing protein, partial [Candidatus Syntrophosphaera sp.]